MVSHVILVSSFFSFSETAEPSFSFLLLFAVLDFLPALFKNWTVGFLTDELIQALEDQITSQAFGLTC